MVLFLMMLQTVSFKLFETFQLTKHVTACTDATVDCEPLLLNDPENTGLRPQLE